MYKRLLPSTTNKTQWNNAANSGPIVKTHHSNVLTLSSTCSAPLFHRKPQSGRAQRQGDDGQPAIDHGTSKNDMASTGKGLHNHAWKIMDNHGRSSKEMGDLWHYWRVNAATRHFGPDLWGVLMESLPICGPLEQPSIPSSQAGGPLKSGAQVRCRKNFCEATI